MRAFQSMGWSLENAKLKERRSPRTRKLSRFWSGSLVHKLAAVNGSVLAIVLLGLVSGLQVSKHIGHQAQIIEQEASEDVETVIRLRKSLLGMVVHEQMLLDAQSGSLSFSEETFDKSVESLISHYAKFKHCWQVLQNSNEFNSGELDKTAEAEIADSIIDEHGLDVAKYVVDFDAFLLKLESVSLSSQEIQAELRTLKNNDFVTELSSFLDKIEALSDATKEGFVEAQETLEYAENLQTKIIIGSFVISGVLGLLLTIVLSRMLMRPLTEMTAIAKESIQSKNFDLDVPVQTDDEAGQLAETFNAYMKFVNDLLKKQETSNQQLHTTLQELKRTQGQIIQSAKMSGLGQMVAGVAHEINNPMTFIHSNLSHVQDYTDDLFELIDLYGQHFPEANANIEAKQEELELEFIREDLPKTLSSIRMGSNRVNEIVVSLRNFAHMDEADLKTVDLHQGLDNTLLMLNHRLKAQPHRSKIEIYREYGAIPQVECFASLLNQVFLNILSNAIDSLEEKDKFQRLQLEGGIRATTDQITISTSLIKTVDGKDWAQVSIADNGFGVSLDIQERIFEPFFTTKAIGKGTGMGMSISYQIVSDRHGGELKYQTSPQGGAEFLIQIPLEQSAVAELIMA